jgi:hypothetical protein
MTPPESDLVRLSNAVSIMAIIGWAADVCATIFTTPGWFVVIPVFNLGTTIALAIHLHQEVSERNT